jgi:maleylacetoacetate isomerase
MSQRIRLFSYWRSSSSYRVRIALGFKGVPYEYVAVNLLEGEQAGDAYRVRAPSAQVPCLEVEGEPFIESVAICFLLDGLFAPPPLFPSDPFVRARCLSLVEIINSGTQPLQNLHVLKRMPEADRKPWARAAIERGLAAYETLLARLPTATTRFSVGQQFTLADAFLVPQLYNARRFDVDVSAYPRISAVEQEALALPFVAAAHPDRQPDAPPESRIAG